MNDSVVTFDIHLIYEVYIVQVVKVADFGVARVQSQSGVMTAETGTYRWMAPEVRTFYPCTCQIQRIWFLS